MFRSFVELYHAIVDFGNRRDNPHGVTADQAETYTKEEIIAKLDGKGFMGYLPISYFPTCAAKTKDNNLLKWELREDGSNLHDLYWYPDTRLETPDSAIFAGRLIILDKKINLKVDPYGDWLMGGHSYFLFIDPKGDEYTYTIRNSREGFVVPKFSCALFKFDCTVVEGEKTLTITELYDGLWVDNWRVGASLEAGGVIPHLGPGAGKKDPILKYLREGEKYGN